MSTETTAPNPEKTTPRPGLGSQIVIAITVLVVLIGALAYITITTSNADQANKKAAFENVLKMSSAELESKTVAELNGYRQDIKAAANYSLAFGNITGYDEAVVDHELDQINDLILKKTDR